ncbi:ATP synthase subunit-like protein [Corchorus olitorius]|uniref:ATP synthase subunit-like protein n=1 Tax=Corchorus olitorius TaxID=93759 RepID=A0A1R3GFH1_9ROSI|nr:ATP synthase subunit-like protein [Corchorus olitorius]
MFCGAFEVPIKSPGSGRGQLEITYLEIWGGKKPSSQPAASKGIPKSNTIRGQMMIALEDQDPGYVIEDDETQTPSDYSTEGDSDDDIQAEDSILVTKKKKGRGRYTGKKLDIKTEGGKKALDIEMPHDIERVVGTNARDVANFLCYVVRTISLNIRGNDERFESVCVATMRRMFMLWKNRLHKHYKSFSNDKERLKNTPDDLRGEPKKTPRTLRKESKSTPLEMLADPVTGEKPTADIIWFRQHARKNADGQLEYNNEESKRVGKGLTKGARAADIMQQQHHEEVSELKGINPQLQEMIAIMQAERDEREANEAIREKRLRVDLEKQIREDLQEALRAQAPSFESFQLTETQPPDNNNK